MDRQFASAATAGHPYKPSYNLVMTCPKCNGEMEVGFVAGPRVVEWIEDSLLKRALGVTVSEGKQLPIRTFRCIDCGFLESYAK